MDSSTFDALVTDFYRAATGAVTWDQALDGVCTAFGARCAPLEIVDLRNGHLVALSAGGQELERARLDYIRDFHTINPRVPLVAAKPRGQWIHCHEHFDETFVASDGFYQEFVPAYDMRYSSGVMLPQDEQIVACFGLQLSHRRGPLDSEERVWLQRLGEHLREALLAYERVRKLAAEALAGHTLLSAFPYPMWLIDVERFVFFANPAAQAEQQDGERVALRGPRLALIDNRADRELTVRIDSLYRIGHGARTVLDLRLTQADPPIWLHLSLLAPGQVLGLFGERPQVLATLFDPRAVATLDPFALSNMFGLTPAEARVATQLAAGVTAEDIAIRHGTRIATVRSQISSLLAKLGVARQADVVRVLCQGEALWARVIT